MSIYRILFLCFTISFLSSTSGVLAQEASDYVDLISNTHMESVAILQDTTLDGWAYEMRGGLNGSQASYQNWSQGGVNTVSATASTLFNLMHRNERFGYNLTVNLNYGQARIEDEGTRKTDDKIGVNNKFSYLFNDKRFSAFGNINFTTQFDKGYSYKSDPDGVLISRFFAPAYFSQVVGLGYSPVDYFSVEAGLAIKETIVKDTTLSTRYGLGPGEMFRFEPGYSVIVNFDKTIASNIRLISSLETFTNLRQHAKQTDVHFSNEIIGEINDYMNTSLQFVLVYDADFSKEVQLKQVLAVGVSFNLL